VKIFHNKKYFAYLNYVFIKLCLLLFMNSVAVSTKLYDVLKNKYLRVNRFAK
jgi:hypothetical protein